MDQYPLLGFFASCIGGMFVSGVPLLIMWRKASQEFTNTNKINLEAEWKRLLDLRTVELTRMTERDNQQQTQLDTLQAQHVECQKNEARSAERIKMNEERIKWLEETIIDLKADLLATRKVRKSRATVSPNVGPTSNPTTDEVAPTG